MNNKDAAILIEEIDELEYAMNEWEESFMTGIRDWVDGGMDLSTKQGDCLQKIYGKASGGGDYQEREKI